MKIAGFGTKAPWFHRERAPKISDAITTMHSHFVEKEKQDSRQYTGFVSALVKGAIAPVYESHNP